MNNLNIQGAGFPATNNTWRFLIEMIQSLQQLTALGGTNYILKGLEPDEQSYTDGWVVLNGELLPFMAKGNSGTRIVVVEEKEQVTYLEDIDGDGQGDAKDAYITRHATIADGDAGVLLTSLQKVNPEGLLAIGSAELKVELKGTVALAGDVVDWSLGMKFEKSLSADTTLSFSNPLENKTITLELTANGHAVTLPSTIDNPEALESFDATKINIIQIYCRKSAPGSQGFICGLITI